MGLAIVDTNDAVQAQLRALAYATITGKPLDPPPAPQWASNPSAALAMGLVHEFLVAAQCPSTATVLESECHPLQGSSRDAIAHALGMENVDPSTPLLLHLLATPRAATAVAASPQLPALKPIRTHVLPPPPPAQPQQAPQSPTGVTLEERHPAHSALHTTTGSDAASVSAEDELAGLEEEGDATQPLPSTSPPLPSSAPLTDAAMVRVNPLAESGRSVEALDLPQRGSLIGLQGRGMAGSAAEALDDVLDELLGGGNVVGGADVLAEAVLVSGKQDPTTLDEGAAWAITATRTGGGRHLAPLAPLAPLPTAVVGMEEFDISALLEGTTGPSHDDSDDDALAMMALELPRDSAEDDNGVF